MYKKHYPPALNDEVWRLEKIGKDGSFHKKLNKAGIFSVEDFLRLVVRDPKKLRNVRFASFAFQLYILLKGFMDGFIKLWYVGIGCRFLGVACRIKCGMFL